MTYAEALEKIHEAIEQQPNDESTVVDSEALYKLVRCSAVDTEPFTADELEMVCEFSGLSESAVRGVESLVRMKLASR